MWGSSALVLLPRAGETPSLCPVPASSTRGTAPHGHTQEQDLCSGTPGSSPGPFLLTEPPKTLGPCGLSQHPLLSHQDPPSDLHRMPQVRHTAQKAEFSPCSSSPPSAYSHPRHQQEQSSIHLRETQLQPSETLGYCHCYPHPIWFTASPWLGLSWQYHISRWASSLWPHDLGTAEELGGMDGGVTRWPWLHLPPPFL